MNRRLSSALVCALLIGLISVKNSNASTVVGSTTASSVFSLPDPVQQDPLPTSTNGLGAQPVPAAADNEKVRVKLIHVSFPVTVEGEGLEIRGMKFSAIQKIAIPKHEELVLEYKSIRKDRVWIAKKGVLTSRTSEPFVEVLSSSGKVRVSGFEVPTPILLAPVGSKHHPPKGVDVIAALKLNDYLEGVLSGEMPSGWPLEALKAQAVAARSYTLFQLRTHKKSVYQLEGSVLDQAYVYSLPKPQQEKIRQAIEDTENVVLTEAGKVVKAYYHADCGGQTEDPSHIWGGANPSKKADSVTDEGCAFSPHGKWRYDVSLAELKNKLSAKSSAEAHDLGDLKEVRVVSRTPSRRAALIAFNDGERDLMVSGNELRRVLGYAKLKSTLFSVSQDEDSVQFSGRGFGHGSGLCQWGARFLAEKGTRYVKILNHYYPHAKITSIATE